MLRCGKGAEVQPTAHWSLRRVLQWSTGKVVWNLKPNKRSTDAARWFRMSGKTLGSPDNLVVRR